MDYKVGYQYEVKTKAKGDPNKDTELFCEEIQNFIENQ